jgi:hypothetical protein
MPHIEPYAKLGDELPDHVADLRGRQFLIMPSRDLHKPHCLS